jgi:N-acetyl sugar amidotransferase
MIKDYQMKPLAITFDQFDQTERGRENLDILKSVGADHLHFTLNPKVISRLVHKGFEIVGDPYWVNHVGIYTVPVNLAVALNIPLIIQGENPQLEYGGPASSRDNFVLDKRWRQEFGLMRGFREEDMVDEEISLADLKMLMWPSDEKIKSVGVTTLFYGYFHKWSTPGNVTVSESYGWKAMEEAWPGSWLNYENIDMEFIDIREHLKWLKFGYGRTTDQVNIHIRQGLLTREDGKKIVQERDGKYSQEHMEKLCKFIGINPQEFDRIRDTFANTDIFEKIEGQWRLKVPAGEEVELLKAS